MLLDKRLRIGIFNSCVAIRIFLYNLTNVIFVQLAKPFNFKLLIIIISAFISIGGCGGTGGSSGGGDNQSIESLLKRFPIDGSVDLSAFLDVSEVEILLRDITGQIIKTTTLKYSVVNDDRNIYFAMVWNDETFNNTFTLELGPENFDGIFISFDKNGNQDFDTGDAANSIISARLGSVYNDNHDPELSEDNIEDGFGSLSYNPVTKMYSAEFLIPLNNDINGQDVTITNNTRFNISIFDNITLPEFTGNTGQAFEDGNWKTIELKTVTNVNHPVIPNDLSGLIAFISDHEVPGNGEIYTFNPATFEIKRITNMPELFKDNVSVSNDRTRVAFHGSPDALSFGEYDIYTADIATGSITQLTDNEPVLDGHPAWSSDDSEIAYASFRPEGGARIVIMNTSGEILRDLDTGADDNDPDYLPDGRIVFKTDRFNMQPNVQIAVMDADGTNAEQLTFKTDISDHDPVGDSFSVLFERFNKDTDFSTDPDTGLTPWDIVLVDIASKSEDILVADGWVNWLPVYSPDKKYIAYQKSSGYTDVHLTNKEGTCFGRLIPNISRIRYIDWK